MTFICEILITMVNLSAIIIRPRSETRKHHLRGRRILLGAMVAILCSSNLAQAVEAQPYYAGKNITMLISTSPGGATDVAGRLVMRHLGKYPGPADLDCAKYAGSRRHCRSELSVQYRQAGRPHPARRQSGELSGTDGRSAGSETRFPPA